MGRGKVTEAAAASLNNAAQNEVLNIANAESAYEVHGLRGRINRFGDVVLTASESKIPDWKEDEDSGEITLTHTNTYVLDIARFLAVLHKESGFTAYLEELKAESAADAVASANRVLIDTFSGAKADVDKDVKAVILSNANAQAARTASTKMYSDLLKNIVFDGKFVPLEDGEDFVYADGTPRQYTDKYTVAFDFKVRMSPELRKKLATYKVDAVDTANWQ